LRRTKVGEQDALYSPISKNNGGLLQLPETRGGWVITRRETHGLLAGDTELLDVEPKLLLLHVIDTSALATFNQQGLLAVPSDAQGQKRRLRHHARLHVRRLLESESIKDVTVTWIVLQGRPFVEIAKTARMEKVDLVVMGSYGGRSGHVDKIFFGSTTEKVVRTAGCPVLNVPLPPKPKR
jgi:nucleotide-binding universal stress UspA family protein